MNKLRSYNRNRLLKLEALQLHYGDPAEEIRRRKRAGAFHALVALTLVSGLAAFCGWFLLPFVLQELHRLLLIWLYENLTWDAWAQLVSEIVWLLLMLAMMMGSCLGMVWLIFRITVADVRDYLRSRPGKTQKNTCGD